MNDEAQVYFCLTAGFFSKIEQTKQGKRRIIMEILVRINYSIHHQAALICKKNKVRSTSVILPGTENTA